MLRRLYWRLLAVFTRPERPCMSCHYRRAVFFGGDAGKGICGWCVQIEWWK